MNKHQAVVASTQGVLKCFICGEEVIIVYCKIMWPHNWWYRHLPKKDRS